MSALLTIRFHGELRDLAPKAHEKDGSVAYPLTRKASIKDIIEALGPPHTEIFAIRRGENQTPFTWIPETDAVLDVHPAIPPVDVAKPTFLRPEALPEARFLVDVNVADLGRALRLLGFDAVNRPECSDAELAEISAAEGRILLSRDSRLLKRSRVVHGRLVRSIDPEGRLGEILEFYGLNPPYRPFSRCLCCNRELTPVAKADILDRLEPKTRRYYHEFRACRDCGRIYWAGSHHDHMAAWLRRFLETRRTAATQSETPLSR